MHHDPFDLSAAQLRARVNGLREQATILRYTLVFAVVCCLVAAFGWRNAIERADRLEARVRAQEAIQPANEALSKLLVRDFTSTWCWDVPEKEPGTVEAACWFKFPEKHVRMTP